MERGLSCKHFLNKSQGNNLPINLGNGIDSLNIIGFAAAGSDSQLALQQKLGLWTKWWDWIDFGHCSNPGPDRSVLE